MANADAKLKSKELAKLVEQAAQGDADAFARLYALFVQDIYYLGLRITKNETDAADVVQETMISFYKQLGSLGDVRYLRSYVNKIAYRSAIRFINNQKGDIPPEEDALEKMPNQTREFIPEDYLEDTEKRRYIVELVDQLSEGQRSVVTLFYFNDLPIREIAKILEIKESVVRSRLFRAREELRQRLEKENFDNDDGL
ncbi:MAG: RNA polymerase sigma factor [Oscillospiraceae bacterium]